MKNKNAFTLVELLAVIAILAILVIIALPNVLKMFRDAKVNTFTSEVQNIMRSAESKYVSSSIGNKEIKCFDSSTNVLNLDGRSNILYVVKFNDKGKIVEVSARDEANELIASSSSGIQREDIGKKYKVEEAKTSITDCKGNQLIDGEKPKTKYVESELNGADPVLGDKMIPIMLSDTGVVTYADEYDEWYKYTSKKWANAVILVDTPSKKYTAGDTILESDIRGYFVWIPKYSYRIFNLGNYEGLESSEPEKSSVQQIEIEFGTRTTVNDETKKECASPMISGETGDCDIGDLMTHPAFLSIPSNGFWVGKFETGYNQNSEIKNPILTTDISSWTTAKAEVTENYSANLEDKIIIKPDVYSWRNQTVATFFQSAYNFNRNLDSHMMKNTEWGAVAYLSHSKYGIQNEVRINNNGNYLTGYAANEKDASSSVANSKWNTGIGHLASTTGNITGVYDMSGGAREFMASYMDGYPKDSGMNSIITNSSYEKYLDEYSNLSTVTSYKYRILGDATGELGPFWFDVYNKCTWYYDSTHFIDSTYSWFPRGGNPSNPINAGQFYFGRSTGIATNSDGTRLVLTPTN